MDKNKEDKKIIIALKKARSHLDIVIKMVETDKYCVDVIQQNLAVIGLLKSAGSKLFKRHLNTCFKRAMKGTNQNQKRKMIKELLEIDRLTNK